MRGKRVIVTGGAGFIGSHLAQELARENEVIILDDLSTGKKENIRALINPSSHSDSSRDSSPITHHPLRLPTNSTNSITPQTGGVQFIQGSIIDLPLLHQLFDGVDCVFHLAAHPNVVESIQEPLKTNEVNITGTLNVLLAARDRKVKKVVYASSSAIYGDAPTPNVETMLANLTSPYALTKLVGEYYCHVFTQIYDLPTVSLRYFNVYGPRQDSNSDYAAVIPKFIDRILTNQPPIIYGDGEQTRDFIFVEDVVKANILAAEQDVAGEAINIACGQNTSINQLADKLIAMLGKKLKPVYTEPQPGDIKYSVADVSKSEKLLGFKPEYTLEKGLPETILSLRGASRAKRENATKQSPLSQ